MSDTRNTSELVWRMAGGSGDGQISVGQFFAKALMRAGLNVFTHQHYTSRIRGGHVFVEVRCGPHEIRSRSDEFDFLVALGDSYARNPAEEAYYGNEEVTPLTENLEDLREGGVIVYDAGLLDVDEVPDFDARVDANDWHVYPLDLRGIAREHGRDVMRNVAGVGATAALLGMDLGPIESVLSDVMAQARLEPNLAVLERAYEHVSAEYGPDEAVVLPEGGHDEEQVLLSGSDAVAYGALDAGCRFVAGYPMTPWTDVFTVMSQALPGFGGIAEQVEDEIAAASLAIGASHAGAKAMTGSSGGGFALMSEPLGLAEMTETPVVFVEAMRAGPSTGLPTKPEQGDLEHVLYTSQGDSNRVVFAPGNHAEAYRQTRTAFDLAYEYQLPAIVVIDQKLAAEYRNLPAAFFDRQPNPDLGSVVSEAELEATMEAGDPFPRYHHDGEDGVSPRSLPGQRGGCYLATGNEHTEFGHISEDPANRVAQMRRRMAKLDAIREDLDARDGNHQTRYGPADATDGILTWGTTQGAVAEAVERLNDDGHSVRALGVSDLVPYPRTEVTAFLEAVDRCLVVELNATGQFRGLTQRELGRFGEKLTSLLKFDGEPFTPAEVVDGFETVVGDGEPPENDHLTVAPPTGARVVTDGGGST